jgi:hypothetical protein
MCVEDIGKLYGLSDTHTRVLLGVVPLVVNGVINISSGDKDRLLDGLGIADSSFKNGLNNLVRVGILRKGNRRGRYHLDGRFRLDGDRIRLVVRYEKDREIEVVND